MILDEIVAHTKKQLAEARENRFRSLFDDRDCVLLCEIKMKSPSHPDAFIHDIDSVLGDYTDAGVDAISVVTDETYFGGSLSMVTKARSTNHPVLRKDFIVEARQIADVPTDAILLIARIVSPETLKDLVHICLKLGIEPVVEVHDETDLAHALDSGANTIAVNSRDLQTQSINKEAALELLSKIPNDKIKLLFSGISSPEDVANARQHGARGVLVGTAALEARDRNEFVQSLKKACS